MCLVAERAEEHGLGVVTGTFTSAFEARRKPGGGSGKFLGGYVTQEVPDEPAGPMYERPGTGQAALDVFVDVGGGVAGVEPAGGEAGEFVAHAGWDVAEGGGESGEGADEGAGFFEAGGFVDGRVRLGGLGRFLRLRGRVGGVFLKVFLWMTVGGRGYRLTDGRFPGARYDLRRCDGFASEELGGLVGGQRHAGDQLLGHPPPTGNLHAPLVHESFLLELPLGAREGACPDPGTFGGAGE
ncbi:hypothetical protein [Streptomyces sp. NPDC013171]|uniref:hypothetical protein n=1 Tax=Streptomyces sp. NPDC013171 TaxID=3364863 RepID=UPI0036C22827